MKNRHYSLLLYFISAVILVTIGIQLYWNYKNYQTGKQQLTNDIQSGVTSALDAYYLDLEKKNTFSVQSDTPGMLDMNFERLLKEVKITSKGIKGLDSLISKSGDSIRILQGKAGQSTQINIKAENDDSLTGKHSNFSASIVISVTKDSLDMDTLNTYIDKQLAAKNIAVNYGYVFNDDDKKILQKYHPQVIDSTNLHAVSRSAYLPEKSLFTIYFTDGTSTIIKRDIIGIILSFLLVGAVVACLFWLLNIIKRQKQLAELKNDLIGNITHEFKTPIATIGVALEGMRDFNSENDPVKTEKYLNTSMVHLRKLGTMVEKILETATLDSGELHLNKSEVRLNTMLQSLANKHRSLNPSKNLSYAPCDDPIKLLADPFHLENALNNLLDNAVKYGGNDIKVWTEIRENRLKITVQDSGNKLSKEQAKHLFDKFYRVPRGNTHDVKGFGIGLYYTKKIVEKHGGTIALVLQPNTRFIIDLPYA